MLAGQQTFLWGGLDGVEDLDEQAQTAAVSGSLKFEQPGADFMRFRAEDLDATLRHRFHPVQHLEFRTDGPDTHQRFRIELQDHVASGQVGCAGGDPVMRQIGARQHQMAGFEWADIISDIGKAVGIGNEMDLPFGMIVPDAYRIWVIVPADQIGRAARQHDLLSRRRESVRNREREI